MRISILLLAFMFPLFAFAADEHMNEHGGGVFHRFALETDIGDSNEGALTTWDFNGWIGADINKLYLKSEGEVVDGKTNQAEFWALYSRNVAEFWDAQIGVRHDTQPVSVTYLTFGFVGLAQYFFETEAHFFLSDKGELSARIREENDFLLTQEIVLQPYVEADFYSQDVAEQDIGAGLAKAEFGLLTRYEITRKFAPYIDLKYERKFGETSSIARLQGEDNDDFIAAVGIKLMF